jgi:hypothetical protein
LNFIIWKGGGLCPPFLFDSVFVRRNAMRTKRTLYITLFSSLIIAANCQHRAIMQQQKETIITKVEFTSLTRGYQKQVFLTADSLVEIIDGRQDDNKVVKRKLPVGEWEVLLKSVRNIPLTEIQQLPSPTSRRAFDGAKHSTITLATRDGKSYSHTFDDENPHEKLQPLMDAIKKVEGGD